MVAQSSRRHRDQNAPPEPASQEGPSLAAAKEAYTSRASAAISDTKERLLDALYPLVEDLDDSERSQFESSIAAAVDSLGSSLSSAVATLQEADAEATRKALKQQKTWYELKLETARTAASVSLNNQAAEMQAAHHRQMEQSLSAANEGGDSALQEAHEKLEELSLRYAGLQMASKQAEDGLRVTRNLLQAAEARAAKLEAERTEAVAKAEAESQEASTARDELERVRRSARRSEEECEVLREGNTRLSEQVTELELEAEEAQADRDEAKDEATDFLRQRDELRHQLVALRAELEAERRRPSERAVQVVVGPEPPTAAAAPAAAPPPAPPVGEPETEPDPKTMEPVELTQEVVRLRRKSEELTQETRVLHLEVDALINMLAEAASETERASLMHDPDGAKALCTRLAVWLRDQALSNRGRRRSEDGSDEQLARLLAELRALTVSHASLEAESRALGLEVAELESESARASAEHKSKVEAGAQALQAMSDARDAALKLAMMAKDGKSLLAAQAELKRLHEEREVFKAEIIKALTEVDIQVEDNRTLTEHLRALVSSSEQATHERKELKQELAATRERLKSTGGVAADPATPSVAGPAGGPTSEDMQLLERQLADARAALRASEESLAEWKASLETWRDEARRVQGELLEARAALDEAVKSVTLLTHDKVSLSEQVQELLRRYQAAEASLNKTAKELTYVTFAMERAQVAYDALSVSADAKVHKIQEVAQKERTVLVTAALRSLQQLRTHLTTTLSGLRVHSEERGGESGMAAWQKWKSKWGVAAQDNAPMTVTLAPPDVPPLNVAKHPGLKYARPSRPSSARPASSASARPGSGPSIQQAASARVLAAPLQTPRRLRGVPADARVAARLQAQHAVGGDQALMRPNSAKGALVPGAS